MAKKCQWCKIKENYHYWRVPSTNHQFIVIMTYNFRQELKIPQKFIECFREELSTWCTLIGPNENKWRVKFVSDMIIFSDGWEKFVSDHGIDVNDIVVFHYAGDSSFKVSVFNGENCCEREGSHFASNTSSSSQKVTCTSSLHFKRAGDNNSSGTSTPAAAAAAPAVGSSQKPIVIDEDDQGSYNDNDQDHDHDHEYDSATTINISEEDEDDQDESEYQRAVWRRRTRARSYYSTTAYCYAERTSRTRLCYVSNRRVPTEEEKKRALEKATRLMKAKSYIEWQNKILSPPMFQITLQPTHVYKSFILTIPKKWAIEHMVHGPQDVKLQVGDRSWIIGYRVTESCNKLVHYLNPNWQKFVLDNNLEEHDSCVFELIQKGHLSVFNVYIFRVIDEIAPLTRSNFRT